MTNAVIGSLRVILGADTAALDKSLKDSQSSLASWGKQVTSIVAGIGIEKIVNNLLFGFRKAVTGGIEAADQMNKLSQSTGLSVESFSKLNYAAGLSDISTESLAKSVSKLSRSMVEAGNDGASNAGQAFKAMGIKVQETDGTLRDSGAVLEDVAGKFAAYRDGAGKTALAIQLFGKSGAAMIPLLNQGKEGLREQGEEAKRYGKVVSTETGVAAEKFNDTLKRFSYLSEGLVLQLSAHMLPSLQQIASAMLTMKEGSSVANLAVDAITGTIKVLGSIVSQTAFVFKSLGVDIAAVFEVAKLATQARFGEIGSVMQKWRDDSARLANEAREFMAKMWGEPTDLEAMSSNVDRFSALMKQVGIAIAQTEAPWKAAGEEAKKTMDGYLTGQAKRAAGMDAEAKTVGLSVGAHERLRVQLEAEALAKEKLIPLTDALSGRIAEAGNKVAQAAMQLQAAQALQMVMSPAEKYAQDLANLQEVYNATDMTAATFAARQQQLAEGIGATWQQVSASAAGGFAQLAGAFSKNSKEMAVTAKGFGIVEATINSYLAFTKALASAPPPLNYVAAAGALAAGMAKVAAIKSQSIGGFMTGGSMTVRGSGGPDSVNVAVSPGETLDVYRADEPGPDRRRGSGGGNTYNIATPLVVSREWVGEMFRALNDGMADGHRFNVVPA